MNYRKIFFLLSFAMLSTQAFSQSMSQVMPKEHKVVIQVTEGDSLTQLTVIGQVKNIKKVLTNCVVEVICHANALDLLTKDKSKAAQHISELSQMNVHFMACENTMARKKVTKENLLPEIKTVPSAMVELILKQEEGWAYVKGGH